MTEKKVLQRGKESSVVAPTEVVRKKVVRRKASLAQQAVYWLMMAFMVGLVLYVAAEVGWTIYHQAGG